MADEEMISFSEKTCRSSSQRRQEKNTTVGTTEQEDDSAFRPRSSSPRQRRGCCPRSCNKEKKKKCVCSAVYTALLFLAIAGVCSSRTGAETSMADAAVFLEVTEEKVGALFVFRGVGMILGAIVVGILCDVVEKCRERRCGDAGNGCLSGRKNVKPRQRGCFICCESLLHHLCSVNGLAVASLLLLAIPSFLIPLWRNSVAFMFLQSIQGFGDSGVVVASTLILPRLWTGKLLAVFMQGYSVAFASSGIVFPLYVGGIFEINYDADTTIMIVYYTAGFILLLPCVLIALPTPRSEAAVMALKSIEDMETDEPTKKEEREATRRCGQCSLSCIFRVLHIAFASVTFMWFCGAESLQALLVPHALALGQKKSLGSFLTGAYFGSSLVGRLLAALILPLLFNTISILSIGLFGATFFVVLLHAFPTSVPFLWVAVIFVALFNSPFFMAIFLVPRRYGIAPTGVETSFLVVFGSVGFFFPTLTNYLMQTVSSSAYMYMVGSYYVLTVICFGLTTVFGFLYERRQLLRDTEKREDDAPLRSRASSTPNSGSSSVEEKT